MSTISTTNTRTSCTKRNYDYYRRFFQLKSNYYHNYNYYSNINASENYYDLTDSQAPVDIIGRNNSTLCFPSAIQMKTKSIMGSSGTNFTKQQKWNIIAKGGKLC